MCPLTLKRFVSSRAALAMTLVASFIASGTAFGGDEVRVVSPNGTVVLTISVDGPLEYQVDYCGRQAIAPSRLGLVFHGETEPARTRLLGTRTNSIDETLHESIGRRSTYAHRCTEATLDLDASGDGISDLVTIARAYDNGFAIRYGLPEGSVYERADETFQIDGESTEFAFAADYPTYASSMKGYNTDQQGFYRRSRLSEIKDDSFVLKPLVVEGDGFCAALAESDLLNWAGMQFNATGANRVGVRLTPRDDGRGAVVAHRAALSPWRVGIFGKNYVDLINNADIIYLCASPPAIDASWIRPGNSSWDWWAPKKRAVTTEAFQKQIDFTAEAGWDYALLDAGWYRRPSEQERDSWNWKDGLIVKDGIDVPWCVRYAREKGVGVILWIDWPDIAQTDLVRTFSTLSSWGVAGVKIDHMNAHSQEMVSALTETVLLAAQYQLLVNYHGMYVPTGMERTFPNQITREGIRGNEYFRGSALPTSHAVVLAFTRMLLGPGDYTPGGFRNEHLETYRPLKDLTAENASCRVVGTRAHELALCMIYDSPLRCYCDLPEVYRGAPGLEYLSALPCVWDDTIALSGSPEEYLVLARRSGDRWYLSCVTNEDARKIAVSFDFLDAGAEYEGTVYVDGPDAEADATSLTIDRRAFRRGDLYVLSLAREGGANIVLTKRHEGETERGN